MHTGVPTANTCAAYTHCDSTSASVDAEADSETRRALDSARRTALCVARRRGIWIARWGVYIWLSAT